MTMYVVVIITMNQRIMMANGNVRTRWTSERSAYSYRIYSRLTGTQEDQNASDEHIRRKAMKDLVQSWMDRLQLISVMVRGSLLPSFTNLTYQ